MIKKEEVKHIAELARLGLTEKELGSFQKELSSILDYFGALKEVDTSKTKPTFHSVEKFSEPMREDKEKPEEPEVVETLKKLAPDKEKGHIKVKAILN